MSTMIFCQMKAKYIEMRNNGQYRLEWFHEYYNNNKPHLDINNFSMIFNMGDLNKILEHLDKKFNLTTLTDINGKFIKICE
jgi:hypothetical protein